MNKLEFVEEFKNLIETEIELSLNTNLLDIDEWDSLSAITTVAFLDSKFNVKATVEQVNNLDTIKDLVKLAGIVD